MARFALEWYGERFGGAHDGELVALSCECESPQQMADYRLTIIKARNDRTRMKATKDGKEFLYYIHGDIKVLPVCA